VSSARYIFRLDDVAPNMKWDAYFSLKTLFITHGISPIIGVIPDNRDPEFTKFPKCSFDFWEEIRTVQGLGWAVAMHGYQHLLNSLNGGILGLSKKGEFAGVPLERQLEKLQAGKEILEKNGVRIDAFMAPAHSFDENTLHALSQIGIRVLTDGFALYPYWRNDILWVPQLTSRPRRFVAGLLTFCLHPNTMSSSDIAILRDFLAKNASKCVSFNDAGRFATESRWNLLGGAALGKFLYIARILKKVMLRSSKEMSSTVRVIPR
jgi:predicted deacetylase